MRNRMILLTAPLFAVACSDDPMRVEFDDGDLLQIRPAFVRVVEGDTIRAAVHSFDQEGNPVFAPDVEWSVLDAELATIDDAGLVTTEGAGWARIVATAASGATDTAVIAIGLRLRTIAVGSDVVCGTEDGGQAWCWGSLWQDYGQFGTGSLGPPSTPAAVAGGHQFDAIAPGGHVTCGIDDQVVYCWGWKGGGVVGVSEPCGNLFQNIGRCVLPMRVDVDSALTFESVAAAVTAFGDATCASGPSGVWCTGATEGGMLGPSPLCSPTCFTPQLVSEDLTGEVVVGAIHACALDAAGAAWCWGRNDDGQLGAEPTETCASTWPCARAPIRVEYPGTFVDISAGNHFTCGLTAAGTAVCWGTYAQYGYAWSMEPTVVGGGVVFESIDAGGGHVCGVADGAAYCWGDEAYSGALGEPIPEYYGPFVVEPRLIASPVSFSAVSAGDGVSCGVASAGGVWCWGSGWSLGQGRYDFSTATPIPLAPPGPIPTDLPAPVSGVLATPAP